MCRLNSALIFHWTLTIAPIESSVESRMLWNRSRNWRLSYKGLCEMDTTALWAFVPESTLITHERKASGRYKPVIQKHSKNSLTSLHFHCKTCYTNVMIFCHNDRSNYYKKKMTYSSNWIQIKAFSAHER